VWQDTNTLRKRPIFRAAGNTKKTTGATVVDLSADDDDDDDDAAACDNDIQVIKFVESHAIEIARSGNTSKYFGSFLHKLTSSCVLCSSFSSGSMSDAISFSLSTVLGSPPPPFFSHDFC
jgi:hypothetical protein